MYFAGSHSYTAMSTLVRQHLIVRAISDMVLDLYESCGLTYSDFVDFSFNRGMLRTIASIDPKAQHPDHLPACLRCRCGSCLTNVEVKSRCFSWRPSFSGGQHQSVATRQVGQVNTGRSRVPTNPAVCMCGQRLYTPGPDTGGSLALSTCGCSGPALCIGISVGLYMTPRKPLAGFAFAFRTPRFFRAMALL